jgi:hypothetical protein
MRPIRTALLSVGLLLASLLVGCQAEPRRVYDTPPAAPVHERPLKPGPDFFWMSGHYDRKDDAEGNPATDGPGWYWVAGRWERDRPNQIWIQGYWKPTQDPEGKDCWEWVPAYWEVQEDKELRHPNRQ